MAIKAPSSPVGSEYQEFGSSQLNRDIGSQYSEFTQGAYKAAEERNKARNKPKNKAGKNSSSDDCVPAALGIKAGLSANKGKLPGFFNNIALSPFAQDFLQAAGVGGEKAPTAEDLQEKTDTTEPEYEDSESIILRRSKTGLTRDICFKPDDLLDMQYIASDLSLSTGVNRQAILRMLYILYAIDNIEDMTKISKGLEIPKLTDNQSVYTYNLIDCVDQKVSRCLYPVLIPYTDSNYTIDGSELKLLIKRDTNERINYLATQFAILSNIDYLKLRKFIWVYAINLIMQEKDTVNYIANAISIDNMLYENMIGYTTTAFLYFDSFFEIYKNEELETIIDDVLDNYEDILNFQSYIGETVLNYPTSINKIIQEDEGNFADLAEVIDRILEEFDEFLISPYSEFEDTDDEDELLDEDADPYNKVLNEAIKNNPMLKNGSGGSAGALGTGALSKIAGMIPKSPLELLNNLGAIPTSPFLQRNFGASPHDRVVNTRSRTSSRKTAAALPSMENARAAIISTIKRDPSYMKLVSSGGTVKDFFIAWHVGGKRNSSNSADEIYEQALPAFVDTLDMACSQIKVTEDTKLKPYIIDIKYKNANPVNPSPGVYTPGAATGELVPKACLVKAICEFEREYMGGKEVRRNGESVEPSSGAKGKQTGIGQQGIPTSIPKVSNQGGKGNTAAGGSPRAATGGQADTGPSATQAGMTASGYSNLEA